MAIIVKTSSPMHGEMLTASEEIYGQPRVSVGSLAYIWTSETASGEGLSARGIVEGAQEAGHRVLRLDIRLVGGPPQRPLTKAMLAPHRNDSAGAPIASLAHKLYRHAHNKIAELSSDEMAFVDRFFENVEPGDR